MRCTFKNAVCVFSPPFFVFDNCAHWVDAAQQSDDIAASSKHYSKFVNKMDEMDAVMQERQYDQEEYSSANVINMAQDLVMPSAASVNMRQAAAAAPRKPVAMKKAKDASYAVMQKNAQFNSRNMHDDDDLD